VSWTTNSSGFFLYAKSPPATGIWSAVQTTPVIVGNEKFVTNAITANDVFYRLQK
jgi:hypothetical protein